MDNQQKAPSNHKYYVTAASLVVITVLLVIFRQDLNLKGNLQRLFDFLSPKPEYHVPAVLLVVIIVLLLLSFLRKDWKKHRANMALGIVLCASFLLVIGTDSKHRWELSVGLLPAVMVVYQAFFLWLYQPKKHENGQSLTGSDDPSGQSYRASIRAQGAITSQFSVKTLLIRYGFPAVLLGITGMTIVSVLVNPDDFFSLARVAEEGKEPIANYGKILLGIKMGSIGAYVYVLLELGRRTFRHDVTGASAMWCLVTLVLGPVLAAAVAVLWRLDSPGENDWWGGGVVLFFTGFAPRRVIAAIEQAAIQLLKVGGQSVVESRLIPLTKIRGISPQIEERLSEEGIVDVNSLAAAEPVRLVRNTAFDLRQILVWIDEAILIVTLPKSWEAFQEEGITGAMDLAWYYDQLFVPWDGPSPPTTPKVIVELANKGKIDPDNLVATIQRLYEDAQVQYIWALYNNFTEHSGGEETHNNGSSTGPKSQSPPLT